MRPGDLHRAIAALPAAADPRLTRLDEIRLRALDIAARTHSGAVRATIAERAEDFVRFVLSGQGGAAAPAGSAPDATQPAAPAEPSAGAAGSARGEPATVR